MVEEPSAEAKLVRYAAICRSLSERVGPLLDVLLSGAKSGDPDLIRFADTIKAERLFGATATVRQIVETGALRHALDSGQARDIVWVLNSPEVYQLLTGDRGWSNDEYEDWLADVMRHCLVEPAAT